MGNFGIFCGKCGIILGFFNLVPFMNSVYKYALKKRVCYDESTNNDGYASMTEMYITYRLRQQKWPIIFTGFWSIYISEPQHIFYLIALGLTILKWGEPSL